MGVVAAVVPWNMPQFLTVTKVVPALLAGCSVVLKPAPESVLDALLLADLVAAADLPPGVFNVVPGGREVGELLVQPPGVDKVSFTGSTAAGRQVALACAEGLKQVSLELGGKSAAIVLDDADPAAVATGIQMASLANSGQVCNALSRILVPAGAQGRVRRRVGRRDGVDDRRRPGRSQHPDRPAGGAAPAGAGPWLHRIGQKRRGTAGGRWRRDARRPRHRLVRAADAVQRRQPTTCGSRAKRSSARC